MIVHDQEHWWGKQNRTELAAAVVVASGGCGEGGGSGSCGLERAVSLALVAQQQIINRVGGETRVQ